MKTKQYQIYGLFDPHGELRYIGQTTQRLSDRLRCHRSRPGSKSQSYHARWLRKLQRMGYRPKIRLIQILPDERSLNEAEIYWIAHFKMLGCNLTNATLGGEGTRGPHKPFSEEAKKNMSIGQKGKKYSPDRKRPPPISEETRMKISIAGKARWARCK